MEVFPAFIPLHGQVVVVAGEGEAADAKARLFEGSPAVLVRLSGPAALEAAAYAGARLAFIAGPEAFAITAATAARAAGALVNVVDRPTLCDFQTPAIVDRGAVVGAIGTTGAAPVLGARLRNALEAAWPMTLGSLAHLLRTLQPEVRAALPDPGERRRFLRQLLDGPAAQAALAGESAAALSLARKALASPSAPRGVLWAVRAPADVEAVSVAAHRALGQVDRIVADRSSAGGLLAIARRDATLTPPGLVSAESLALWARDGETVVCIDPGGGLALAIDEAERLGARVRRFPSP